MVVPFDLINAPSMFNFLMNNVFNKYLDKFVIIFLDDILIYSHIEANDERHFKLVLEFLTEQKLYAKLNKCSYLVSLFPFLMNPNYVFVFIFYAFQDPFWTHLTYSHKIYDEKWDKLP